MKSVFLVLVLLALLAATLWWSVYAWNSVDVEMSIHGYIAMILGIVFSLVIGCGLMAIMFYSSATDTTNRRTAVKDNQTAKLSYEAKDRWTSGALTNQACQC
jgi:TRAP-type C4-dicarboxylate transport system permease small subunit